MQDCKQTCYGLTLQESGYAIYCEKKLLEIDSTDTLPANVPPCTFAGDEFLLRKNVAAAYAPAIRGGTEMSFGNRRCRC